MNMLPFFKKVPAYYLVPRLVYSLLMFAFATVGCQLTTVQIQAQDLPFQEKLLPVLFNPKVQKELELTEEQNAKLKKLLQSIQQSQRGYGKKLEEFKQTGASPSEIDEKRKGFIAELEEEKKDVQKDAIDVLLPHQVKRLKQVTIQVAMRQTSKDSGLLTEEMMSYLEIDANQARKIQSKAAELQQKIMAEIKQLQVKYRKELLKELTAKQRKKYEEAVGDFFAQ